MFKTGVKKEDYIKINILSIAKSVVPLRAFSNNNKELETECLFGEKCEVLSVSEEWVFCKLIKDKYRGWIKKSSLGLEVYPTHKINVKNSIIFDKPNVKSRPYAYLSFGSELEVTSTNNNWSKIYFSKGSKYFFKYIPTNHLVDINYIKKDWVNTAEIFLHTPYKWGGKSFLGIDCSALSQLALFSKCQKAFRNSSQQEKQIGKLIYNQRDEIKLQNLKRGDLIFWKGHVGIMINEKEIIHANAHHACVEKENLINTISRMNKNGLQIKAIKRP